MNTALKTFESPEHGTLRVAILDGEPWFVGRDAATVLGYKNVTDALNRHVKKEDKVLTKVPAAKGGRDTTMVALSRDGFMKLAISGKPPKPDVFSDWVEKEVIPYLEEEVIDENSATIASLEAALREEREKNKALMVKFGGSDFGHLTTVVSEGAITLFDFCKILTTVAYPMDVEGIRLWFKESGFLSHKKGASWSCPILKYVKEGMFEVLVESSGQDGEIKKTTFVTPYGVRHITAELLASLDSSGDSVGGEDE